MAPVGGGEGAAVLVEEGLVSDKAVPGWAREGPSRFSRYPSAELLIYNLLPSFLPSPSVPLETMKAW